MSGGRVLVGFAEALAAPESVWSLLDAGFEVHAFERAGTRSALRRLRSLSVHTVAAPQEDAAACARQLRALLEELRPDAVLPLDDAALHLAAAATVGTGSVLAGPSGDQLSLALDKARQVEAARAAGFRVPRTVVCQRADVPADAPIPAVVKPAGAILHSGGRLVRGAARVCVDRSQLREAVGRLGADGPALVQELVPGNGEGLFGLAMQGRAGAWSAHRRLRMMNPAGSGSSACVSIRPDPQALACAERLLGAAAWSGLFMVELMRDPQGRAWFIELNGRPWGSMALARRGGLEYPAWAVSASLGQEWPREVPVPRPGLRCRHLGRELVHLLFVLRGTDRPGPDWPSRGASLRQVLAVRPGDRWYNWRSGNAGLFVEDTVRTVAGAVTRRSA